MVSYWSFGKSLKTTTPSSSEISEVKAAELIAHAPSYRDGPRLRSTQGGGAGAWLQPITLSQNYVLKSSEFQIASCLGLGHPLPFSKYVTQCECGASLDPLGYHLLTCKFGGGPVWQHNCFVSTWSKCLKRVQLETQIEPSNKYTNSENRPDTVPFDSSNNYSSTELDVSMVHPLSGDTVNSAAVESGYAAKKREVRKDKKYSPQLSQH